MTTQVDFEAELAVVIGRSAKHVSVDEALDYVLGYTCANDVSARDWQKEKRLNGGQFARGKSFDGFCPIGPEIVTADEVPDPQKLAIRCEVNGETMQQSTTGRHDLRRPRDHREPEHDDDPSAGLRDPHRHAAGGSGWRATRRSG